MLRASSGTPATRGRTRCSSRPWRPASGTHGLTRAGAHQKGSVHEMGPESCVREMLTVCFPVETCSCLEQAVTLHPSLCVCSYETYAQVLATK